MRGKPVSENIRQQIKEEVEKLEVKPNLTVIKVGNDPASETYVRNKIKACEEVGMLSTLIQLPDTIEESELISIIGTLNKSPMTHGILVQLPLPDHINEDTVAHAITPSKDVDCFHPYNVGRLYNEKGHIKPCTPSGVISIIQHYGKEIAGADVVIVGRSNIVGKPLATMLTNMGATVTVCHSRTKDLASKTRRADIVVTAIGSAKFFGPEYFGPDAIIVDVGINRDEDGKLCGDVDYYNVVDNVNAITPVPGGVGIMTVTHLLYNTLQCYLYQI